MLRVIGFLSEAELGCFLLRKIALNRTCEGHCEGWLKEVAFFKEQKKETNKRKTPGLNDSQTGTSPRGLGEPHFKPCFKCLSQY